MLINVASQFSPFPAGRFRSDGEFSGERFRDELLRPALERDTEVTVVLAGTKGYGSSFLEEAFGGLVRYGHFSADELSRRLRIEAGDAAYEMYKRRAEKYIRQARFGADRKASEG